MSTRCRSWTPLPGTSSSSVGSLTISGETGVSAARESVVMCGLVPRLSVIEPAVEENTAFRGLLLGQLAVVLELGAVLGGVDRVVRLVTGFRRPRELPDDD